MKILSLLYEAANNVLLHKGRSVLAVLGIIFGVASVICMLSISEVARQDVIQRMQRLGINNLIVDSVKPERIRRREREDAEESWLSSYGISRVDLDILRRGVPEIQNIVPLRVMMKDVVANQKVSDIAVVATTPAYVDVMAHPVRQGRFITAVDEANSRPVCVLGADAARKLFPLKSPVGNVVKIGGVFFDVVGVMDHKGATGSAGTFSDPDNAAFIPFQTTFARFGRLQVRQGEGSAEATQLEVNRAVLQVPEPALLQPLAQVTRNLMRARHRQDDVSVTVPLELVRERRQSERIFRWVMGSLTAIALLVGGIGIMNIMLANMAERRQEIGLRRALGARQGHIVALFVAESTLLCMLGGILGVALGLGLAAAVGRLAEWSIVYHAWSIPLGILVSVTVGLLFGTVPALRAARQDPVLALRAE